MTEPKKSTNVLLGLHAPVGEFHASSDLPVVYSTGTEVSESDASKILAISGPDGPVHLIEGK